MFQFLRPTALLHFIGRWWILLIRLQWCRCDTKISAYSIEKLMTYLRATLTLIHARSRKRIFARYANQIAPSAAHWSERNRTIARRPILIFESEKNRASRRVTLSRKSSRAHASGTANEESSRWKYRKSLAGFLERHYRRDDRSLSLPRDLTDN